jgi:hypothetical protein
VDSLFDLGYLLLWLPRALWRLWCWLTEERALVHQTKADLPEMQNVRLVSQVTLGLWLLGSVMAAAHWFDDWGDTWLSFFTGLAIFIAGPVLLVVLTGRWRDRIVERHGGPGFS